jgi:hypothetical protein
MMKKTLRVIVQPRETQKPSPVGFFLFVNCLGKIESEIERP